MSSHDEESSCLALQRQQPARVGNCRTASGPPMNISLLPAWLQRRAIFLILITTSVTASCARPAPVGSGPWLLDSLQRLADDGSLFEPNRVAQVLDLQIAPATPKELNDQPPACRSPTDDRSLIVLKYSVMPPWLKPTLQGVQGMYVPEFTINKAGTSGNSSFTYVELNSRPCSDRYNFLAENRKATLDIGGLPAFVCYHRHELEQRFGERERLHTDGVSSVDYVVNDHDDRSTYLSFTFRFGAPCALSARLEQGVRWSRRWDRANSKWQQCRMNSEKRYVELHGPVNIVDDEAVAPMREAVADACGSLTDYYVREPI